MEIANLVLRISSDGKGLSQGLSQMTSSIKRLQQVISAGLVTQLIKQTVDYASSLNDLSSKTGISTNALQAWGYAAKQNGSSLEEISSAFKNLSKSIVEAVGGDEKKLAAFSRLGIDIQKLRNQKPEDIFESVARAFKDIPPSAIATSDALALMGKTGDNVLPPMRDGFADLADEARRTNQIIGTETIAQLDALGDEVDRLKGRWTSLFAPLVGWAAKQARNTTDLIESFVALPAATLGAMSGGASDRSAAEAGWDAVKRVIDARISDENAMKQRAERIATGTAIPLADTNAPVGSAGESTGSAPSIRVPIPSDALSRIGLFRGGRAESVIPVLQQQLSQLQKIVAEMQSLNYQINAD